MWFVFLALTLSAWATDPSGEDSRSKCNLYWHLKQLTQDFSKYVPEHDPNDGFEPSFAREIREGRGPLTEERLRRSGVHPALIPFYDLNTGEFNYRRAKALTLALENGDEKLSTLRVNATGKKSKAKAISKELIAGYTKILASDPTIKLVILTSDDQIDIFAQEVDHLRKDIRSRIEVVPYNKNREDAPSLSLWAQDLSKPIQGGQKSTLIPRVGSRDTLFHFKDNLSTAGISIEESLVDFDGGNVVVGAKHVFVGSEIVELCMRKFFIERENALKVLSEEFGKPVFEIGYTDIENPKRKSQVDFHIDLTMAVVRDRKTGREVVLLGSVDKAVDLLLSTEDLGGLSGIEKNSVRTLEEVAASNDVPRLDKGRLLHALGDERDVGSVLYERARLAEIKQNLIAAGYDVIEVPRIHNARIHKDLKYYFNYTNSIFSGSTAIIGELGIPVWDRYMKNTLGDLGYEVYPLKVVQKSLCLNGGVRCLTETYRKPPPKPRPSAPSGRSGQ